MSERPAAHLAAAEQQRAAGQRSESAATYREALTAARDEDQIQAAADALKELGEEVDLATHFGFVTEWHLIGPFDNRGKIGFDTVYPPEREIKLADTYSGKEGPVGWKHHRTVDPYGIVDLNQAIGKHMGAVAYAVAYFDAGQARDVEVRVGCINGNKFWLNGQLLSANHVYHSGTSIDQYRGKGKLKQGRNVLLVKICQNEQTEAWAQRWQFQLRVCDSLGTAVLPVDRLAFGPFSPVRLTARP